MNHKFDDFDVFDDDDILIPNAEEPLWDSLIDNIIDGKVIPVIGPEMVTINGKDINTFIIDGISRKIGISEPLHSFSELVYTKEYRSLYGNKDNIYYQVNRLFSKRHFPANPLLERLLAIRQFPFIITSSFCPIIEDCMREIWKDELRVLRFNNNPMENDDIKTGADLRKPTIFYMLGKVCNGIKKYVLTDTDMLDFVSSWLSNDNRVKPKNLCNELKDKYLLMLGNNYSNWLFRFIWYSIRKSSPNKGMLAYDNKDSSLINFLERHEIFTKQNISEVVDQIISRLNKKLVENEKTKFNKPEDNLDIFISYSRKDSDIAEKLYYSLSAQGKRVWYDKNNLTEGGDFMEEIKKAIRSAKYFIPILTNNITKEKEYSHIYRNEWDEAIKVAISMGRTYIIPLAQYEFDFYHASIPDRIQQCNALFFSNQESIDEITKKLIHKMNQEG